MILKIGLTNQDSLWIQVLDQEKIDYQIIEKLEFRETPLIIFFNSNAFSSHEIERFLATGGVGIFDKRNRQDAKFKDRVVEVDFGELSDLSSNWNVIEKAFQYERYEVTERVAQFKKSETRKKITSLIKQAFKCLNLPYVHLWYYPKNYETVFGFRFDLDEHQDQDFQVMYELIKQYKEMMSCFVCMKTYEKYLKEIQQLAALDCELGSHAYIHHVYNTYDQNRYNLLTAEQLLKTCTNRFDGFAGPHGKWHPTLQRVLDESGYLYSSQFCYDYDNFPLFPILEKGFSKVLHIATHPVCEGVFLQKYPYDEKMFDKYYSEVIQELADQHLPIFIFGHPDNRIGRYPKILHNIIKRIYERKNVWRTHLRDFAKWWIERHNQRFTLCYEDGKLHVSDSLARHYSWEVIIPDGRSRLINQEQMSKGIELNMNFSGQEPKSATIKIKEGAVKHSLWKRVKISIKEYLDWETKTPLNELHRSDFQSWLKVFLRAFFDILVKKDSQSSY